MLAFAGVNPGQQLDAIIIDTAAPVPGEVDAHPLPQ